AAMTLVNYYLGLAIERWSQWRTLSLITAIAFDLAVLGFFKYYNFFVESANTLLSSIGWTISMLDIVLPVGISFITFQALAYVIDIYRGETRSAKNIWEFALLTAFFPQLVAGPIIKARQFLPELQKKVILKRENLLQGGQLFMLGFFRKVMIADRLALFVDTVFAAPQDYSTVTLWLVTIAYAIQIYCDFSGYSDMAIGTAKCLGYDSPINFNVPYRSRSITEFWRRWHISLSTWLREYLYIPLGGNRKGKLRQYLNLMIVMLLGGLWHGASWNFVLWGGLHGVALATHKFYADYLRSRLQIPPSLHTVLAWLVTLLFIGLTWVLFRASDFAIASAMVKKMFALTDTAGINWYATSLWLSLPAMVLADYFGVLINQGVWLKLNRFSEWFWLWFWLLGFLLLAPNNPQPFVYFQF
ncbi:MAG: MBOAT family protein, partial [Cyanobacteria bacterium P01_D01_bin.44]